MERETSYKLAMDIYNNVKTGADFIAIIHMLENCKPVTDRVNYETADQINKAIEHMKEFLSL